MTTLNASVRMTTEELRSYWLDLSRQYLASSENGFEVICYAGMPDWFNRFIHRYQAKAFRRLLRGQSFASCDILDIGTGVGRWARWYAGWPGARVVGIDLDSARLARAASLGDGPRYEVMSVDALEFEDDAFDVVNCITVLQHVPPAAKEKALSEVARVLRPGGRAVFFEITDMSDDAPHVFPWSREEWKSAFSSRHLSIARTTGEQYVPLLRLLKRVHGMAYADASRSQIDALKSGRSGQVDRAKMVALRAAIAASYPLEEACRFLPPGFARITGFLVEKSLPGTGERA